jgi:hypothetical protein
MAKRDQSLTALLAERSALTQEVLRLRSSEQALREQNDELLENQRLLEDARDDFTELYDGASQALLTPGEHGQIRSANLAAAGYSSGSALGSSVALSGCYFASRIARV